LGGNLANLTLARAASRSHEMSLRAAIGASRAALAVQVLTESPALSLVGALLGLVLSYWGSRSLVAFMAEGTVSFDLCPDLRVLSIAISIGVLTGILFGLAPTWPSSQQDPVVVLQQGSRRSLAGGAGKLGKALIVTQVALSLVLLLGAGLLVRTFQELRSLNLGFEKYDLLEIILNAKPGGDQNLDTNNYRKQLIERVSNIPGVLSVALADISIPSPEGWRENASPTSEDPNTGARLMANGITIWPGFFKTFGIRLIAGRSFEVADNAQHPRLVIVSRSFAARLFGQRRCHWKAYSFRLHAGLPES
jgi:FtsX-like permease family